MEIWTGLIYHGQDCSRYYEVSDRGELRNARTKRVLKLHPNHKGYLHTVVTLGSRKNKKAIIIHRAVAENFIPNPDQLPEVNHKNGNKNNNSVTNLEWCTNFYNIQHALQFGLCNNSGWNNGQSKLSQQDIFDIKQMRLEGLSIKDIARTFNVCDKTIYNLLNGKSYTLRCCEVG